MSGRWKRTSLVVAVAVAAVVAAVAATVNATAGSKRASAGTLNIMGFGKGDDVAESRAALALKALNGVDVKRPSGGFNDQQFLAAVAGGTVPDLVYLDRAKVGTYAAKGAFQPLNSCIKSQKINTKQYRKAALAEVTYKGKIYGIPEFYSVRTVMVDLDVLKESGVKLADLNTANWTKLKAAAKKMYKSSGGKVTRIGFDPKIDSTSFGFPLWAKANGATILSKDGLHAHLNSKRAIQALTYAVSLVKLQGGWGKFKSFRDTWDFFGAGNEFAKDQTGAFPIEDFYYAVLARTSPQIHLHALLFRARNGQPISLETGSAWAIPKGSKNAKAACTWAKVMTETSTWLAAAKNRVKLRKAAHDVYTPLSTGNAVADSKILKQTYSSINKYFDQGVKTVEQAKQHSFYIPASPASAEFNTAWADAIGRVLAGEQSPAAALNQAQKEAQKAINKAK
jgi:multiple sugar transport system substrate-binding protein